MSEPEKYTLDRVLEIVRGHAESLQNAGEALRATEGKDPEILALVGQRATKAAEDIRAVENVRGVQGHDDIPEFVDLLVGGLEDRLPLLALAVEAVAADPEDQAHWCSLEAQRIADVLMEWVEAHEKDAEPVTDNEENEGDTSPVSEPEEPQESAEPESPKAEIIRLPAGIAGVGRAGDSIVHDPGHPDSKYRLSIVTPLDVEFLPQIKERVRLMKDAPGA